MRRPTLAAACLLLLLVSSAARAQFFDVDLIEPSATVAHGFYINFVLDSQGHAHATYCEQGLASNNKLLRYATNASGTWVAQYVGAISPSDVNLYPSIALDPSDVPHIVYYDGAGQHAYLVSKTGATTWSSPDIIDPLHNYGQYPHLAIDALGGKHVVYFRGNTSQIGALYYAYKGPASSIWTKQVVDSVPNDAQGGWSIGTQNDITTKPDKTPVVIYSKWHSYVPLNLEFAMLAYPGCSLVDYPPDGWCNFDEIHHEVPNGVGIACDASGNVHVAYEASGTCYYRKQVAGVWDPEVAVATNLDGFLPADIALDPTGRPEIVFTRFNDIMIAAIPADTWVLRTVEAAPSLRPQYPSIALTSGYLAQVAYQAGSFARFATQIIPIGVGDGPSALDQPMLRLVSENPAREHARLEAAIPAQLVGSPFRVEIVDVTGRLVRVADSGAALGSSRSVNWQLDDEAGRAVQSGVYFARLVVGGQRSTVRLAVVR